MQTPDRKTWWMLLPFVLAVAAVAVAGSVAANDSRQTYKALDLPAFAPPGWLFGPVWTVLYVFIAVAGWLLSQTDDRRRLVALWVVQLLLNLLWTPLFFAGDLYGLALADIVLLDLVVVVLLVLAWPRSRWGALLLAPYLAWILFATALNAGVLALN